MKKIHIFIAILLISSFELFATQAYPYLTTFTQPDSSTVMVYIRGDEKIHWLESEDGYSLLCNDFGYLVYAVQDNNGDMIPSNIIATNKSLRSSEVQEFLKTTPKYLRYTKEQINTMVEVWNMVEGQQAKQKSTTVTKGEVKLLLILMQFTDKSFTRTTAEIERLFNQVNYTTGGLAGSVHDYYYANSYGKLSLTFDVVGPYTTANATAYYGNRGNTGYQAFAREAINAAAADVDYSDYDNDGDGEMDGLHILFAGFGEEASGNAAHIWSHKSVLSQSIRHDQTTISKYSCSPELRGSSGRNLTHIGVICHELGHVFGAPDYYDTDYDESGGSYPGTGEWDLMGSGNWNDNGMRPAHHNPYTKIYIYGWADAINLDSSSRSVVMKSSSSSANSFYCYSTTTRNEFFLMENRQWENFDASVPGKGMIIYRVHSSMHPDAYNVNVTHPQKFYPISASSYYNLPNTSVSSYGSINSSSCPFPGSRSKTSFTDNTAPSSISWAGNPTNQPVTNIEMNTTYKTVSFVFNNGDKNPDNFEAVPLSSSSLKLSWLPFGSLSVMVVYSSDSIFGTPDSVEYTAGQTINGGGEVLYVGNNIDFEHQNLNPEQKYYYKIYSKLDNTVAWSSGITLSATTPCRQMTVYPYYQSFEDDDLPACWTMETDNDVMWKIDTNISPKDGEQCVIARLDDYENTGKVVRLISAPMDLSQLDSAYISFWFTLRKRAVYQDSLTVMCRNSFSGEWEVLKTYSHTAASWKKDTLQLSTLSDYCQIAFEATLNLGNGIALDNIIVFSDKEYLGIDDVYGNVPNIKLYPNPAKENVYISISQDNNEKTECYVYDMVGRIMTTETIEGNGVYMMDTKSLISGTYIIKFKSQTFEKTETLIIK